VVMSGGGGGGGGNILPAVGVGWVYQQQHRGHTQ